MAVVCPLETCSEELRTRGHWVQVLVELVQSLLVAVEWELAPLIAVMEVPGCWVEGLEAWEPFRLSNFEREIA